MTIGAVGAVKYARKPKHHLSNVGGTDLTILTLGQTCHFDQERGEIYQIVTNVRTVWEDFSQKALEMTSFWGQSSVERGQLTGGFPAQIG